MKITKKLIALTICLLMTVSTVGLLSGCGQRQSYDSTKTQLFVATYDGGYKSEWIDKVAERFEAAYADYQIGNRTGVEIIVERTTDFGNSLFQNWGAASSEIYFTESVNYYDFVNAGRFLDLTDIITEDIPGEGRSIYSKFNDQQKEYYAAEGTDGEDHFYGIPFASGFAGLVYDIDLFYTKGLYLVRESDTDSSLSGADKYIRNTQKDANGNYYTEVQESDITYRRTTAGDYLSKGPDGVYGTYDDGLPSTYSDFFELCEYMSIEKNVTPFAWSGKAQSGYFTWLLAELAADYEGAEQMKNYFDFSGTATNLIEVLPDGTVTPLEDANLDESPLEIYKSAGRYYAYDFVNRMFAGDSQFIDRDSTGSTVDQYGAQRYYLEANSQGSSKRNIAFLLDGIWWQNEASDAFARLGSLNAEDSKENRQFGFLPLPKQDDAELGGATLLDTHNTLGFVRSDIQAHKIDLAKAFMQFCFTDVSNKEFTLTTGVQRPLDYNLTETEMSQLSPFERNVWEMFHNADNSVVYPYSKSEFYLNNAPNVMVNNIFYTRINGTNYINVLEPLRETNASVVEIFNGVYDYANATLIR